MKTKSTDIIMQGKAFGLVALGTCFILMIPLVMTQLSAEWNWSLSDFVIIGALLLGMGSLYVLAARKIRKNRLIVGALFLITVLYIWAELAVGIFTNLGS